MGVVKLLQQGLRRMPVFHRALRSVWRPPERIYRHLYFNGRFSVEVEPGVRFRMISHGYQVENRLFWGGFGNGWEAGSLRIWLEMVRDAGFVADIGANTGVYALSAQCLNPGARVVAVEPSARVCAKLKANAELNRFPVTVLECAVSDRNGVAQFYDFPTEHQYSASLETHFGGQPLAEVEVARFDDLMERIGVPRIDALKLDVELHEPAALRGMRTILERDRPSMLVEILDEGHMAAIAAEIAGLDYVVRRVTDGRQDVERNCLIAQPDRLAILERRLPEGLLG